MTALRQKALSIVESLPEEKILVLLNFLHDMEGITEKNKRLAIKKVAFEELENLRRRIPDLDYEEELATYREERFGNANFD